MSTADPFDSINPSTAAPSPSGTSPASHTPVLEGMAQGATPTRAMTGTTSVNGAPSVSAVARCCVKAFRCSSGTSFGESAERTPPMISASVTVAS